MVDEARLSTLLLEWQDRVEQGQDVAVADLCRAWPQLLPELQRRIEALRRMERLAHAVNASTPRGGFDATLSQAGPVPARSVPAPTPSAAADPQATRGNSSLVVGAPPSPNALAPGVPPALHVPGYEILGLLGKGGMGVVYQARQAGLARFVALKMILHAEHANDSDRKRFRREAEAVAHLQHPNIVQIYEVGEHNGRPYFSLEFCPGGSLETKLKATPLPAREAAALLEKLARAMHAAHVKGIVHRDLKPPNVLLLDDGTPKITDFGMVKLLDESQGPTRSGAVMGTPSYMAPEQAQGKTHAIGPASDVYALGAILYEVLTGRPPFRAATTMETLLQVIGQEPAPPQRLQPGVPRDLDTICLKCLQKEPARRYASAAALADDLHRFLGGEPIQARPIGTWERTVKWTRRKPAAAALVALILLAPVVFSALYALYASERAAQQAELYKQDLKRHSDQEAVRERSRQSLGRAQKLEVAGAWYEANTELAKAWAALEGQPDPGADDLRSAVRRRLDAVQQQLRHQEQHQQAQQRLQQFQGPHDDALFYHTLFTGRDAADSRDRARAAARKGLAIYGLAAAGAPEDTAVLLERERTHLGAGEFRGLAEACYELLLIWAETEAGGPGQVEAGGQGRQRAATALALLARAARLGKAHGLETRTYQLRKARYTAQSKGAAIDPAALDRAVPMRPTGALDWFLEGLERYRAGRFEQATQACGEVLRRHEDHFWARYVHALCDLRLGRWVDAKAELSICINHRPAFVWPRLLRGFAASELGFKYTGEQLAADEFKLAEEDFDLALKQDPDRIVQYVGLANRGVLNIRRKRWAAASADLQQALKVNPAGFQAYVNLALAYEGQDKLDDALAMLNQAIARAPDVAMVYESRARLHLRRKHWAAARADLEQAIAHEPKDSKSEGLVDNLVELGRLLHQEGKYAAALEHFNRALALQPELVLTERLRAETLLALDRPEDAAKALDHYLAQTPVPRPEVYQARGLLYAGKGQLPAAIEMYTLALRRNPADKVTRCYRGWTYLLTDAVPLAMKDFKVCLEADPANPDALIGRGTAHVRQHQLEDALDDAEAAEKRGPLSDRLLYNLTRLYALAAVQLEVDARGFRASAAQRAAQRMAYCKARALDCLGQTLEKLPEERRPAFWRNQVQSDPALTPLRSGSVYALLAARYGGNGSRRSAP